MRAWLLIVVFAATGLICGCGGGDGDASEDAVAALAVPWVDPDGDPPYIGSLSVNPRDGTLLMGTNTGLFEIPAAGGKRRHAGTRAADGCGDAAPRRSPGSGSE